MTENEDSRELPRRYHFTEMADGTRSDFAQERMWVDADNIICSERHSMTEEEWTAAIRHEEVLEMERIRQGAPIEYLHDFGPLLQYPPTVFVHRDDAGS